MYNDDVTAAPRDLAHFWEMAEENYEFARHVLTDYAIESRNDALADVIRPAMLVLAYRNISDDYDQRQHFLELGRATLPVVRELLDKQELTPQFAQEWGKLMYCHGFLASFVFDDSDDMANARAAYKSAEARSPARRRRWLAEVMRLRRFAGIKRESLDADVAALLAEMRSEPSTKAEYPAGWFDDFLTIEGELRSSFQAKNFGWSKIDKLRDEPPIDLPPLPDDRP